jgi:type IV pilus assembly protein PilM
MAELQSAWGIEIGQAGLKAIRLRYAPEAGQVIVAAFDYVPHPKLLSQPDAVPDELIRQALGTFLSRNQLGSDLVAISLPGQTALAKFIQLPPVEADRVSAIVRYEAQQQIPFALEEVIWDWQILGTGLQEGGFLLDAEVGLFAMKREQVQHHLRPYLERKVEVELVQIAPLALFNFLCFDRLGIRPDRERPEIEDFTILLDMGCDNTTLLVTNGKKIWIRNVPIGGNHFTRALTKEMKLTFAKAEHLKCNATKSHDPRSVFQALRPVFNDYVSEIQRSIGYFSSVNRTAKIGRLVGVGNGFKLAGLQKFLQQNLQYEVDRIDHFQGLVGDHVLTAPVFQDNLLTFAVPYGLALQTLKLTDIHTTLLPREIAMARKIRRKKPWAVATAASLLVGMSLSAAGYANVWHSVSTQRFGTAESETEKLGQDVSSLKSKYSAEEGRNKAARSRGEQLVSMLPTRELWMEVYKAINECLPRDEGQQLDETELAKMHRISLDSITCKRYNDLSEWYNKLPENTRTTYLDESDKATPPSGSGYVFTLNGHHYHHEPNNPTEGQGYQYVLATLVRNLRKDYIQRIDASGQVTLTDVKRLGISHSLVTWAPRAVDTPFFPHGRPGGPGRGPFGPGRGAYGAGAAPFGPGMTGYAPPGAAPFPPGGQSGGLTPMGNLPGRQLPGTSALASGRIPNLEDSGSAQPIILKLTRFTVQFVWKPTPVAQRKELVFEAPADPQPPGGTPVTPAPGLDAAAPLAPGAGGPPNSPTAPTPPLPPSTP